MIGHLLEMEFNILRGKYVIPHGEIIRDNEHLLLATPSTKTATEIEENTIKEAKTSFPTACPRGN